MYSKLSCLISVFHLELSIVDTFLVIIFVNQNKLPQYKHINNLFSDWFAVRIGRSMTTFTYKVYHNVYTTIYHQFLYQLK